MEIAWGGLNFHIEAIFLEAGLSSADISLAYTTMTVTGIATGLFCGGCIVPNLPLTILLYHYITVSLYHHKYIISLYHYSRISLYYYGYCWLAQRLCMVAFRLRLLLSVLIGV